MYTRNITSTSEASPWKNYRSPPPPFVTPRPHQCLPSNPTCSLDRLPAISHSAPIPLAAIFQLLPRTRLSLPPLDTPLSPLAASSLSAVTTRSAFSMVSSPHKSPHHQPLAAILAVILAPLAPFSTPKVEYSTMYSSIPLHIPRSTGTRYSRAVTSRAS